jgi:hypothetical protein
LARAADTTFVREPDGPYSDVLGAVLDAKMGPFPCVAPHDNPRWYRLVWDLAFKGGWPWQHWEPAKVAGRRIVRVPAGVRDVGVGMLARTVTTFRPEPPNMVIKSVNSAFSLEWITNRYRFDSIVMMRRNLLNVVSSWMALEWPLIDPPLEHHPLIRELFIERLGIAEPPSPSDYTAKTAWQVGLLTSAVKLFADSHLEVMVESHDDYCLDPQACFSDLFQRIGLEWTPEIDRYLVNADRPGYTGVFPVRVTKEQPTQWRRRLSNDQVTTIQRVLAGFPLGEWAESALEVPA